MIEQAIILHDEAQRQRALKIIGLLKIDKPLEVLVRPYVEKRSLTQNARLWALHTKASQATGYAPEEMHELALCRFFGFQDLDLGGIKRQIPLQRSSTRNKKEFAEFMEATEAWYISELGIWLE